MNKILATLAIILLIPYNAMAASTSACSVVACETPFGRSILNPGASCAGSDLGFMMATCYKNPTTSEILLLYNCGPCTGDKEEKTISVSTECGTLKYTDCVSPCTPDADFVSTGTAGYEKKTTCTSSGLSATQYRCAAGWYGTSSNGTTGCTQCPPSAESAATAQSAAGTTDVSGCYIPAGNSFSDTAGAGTYSSNCGY